ncbi:MAG: hypothetical protein K0S56_966 [Microvirga sp.]|nr:hypothetical protein [Microvirga sp.]
MERRSFLKGSALCIATVAAGIPATNVLATPSVTLVLRSPAWVRLGERARKELPTFEIARLDAEAGPIIELLSTSRPDLRARLADEMREGRTVCVGGVTFARSEAALFVFASRAPLA